MIDMGKWTEIRNDYVDELNYNEGNVTMSIDAWKSNDDNAEGISIAEIKLTFDTSVPIIEISYKDNDAKKDEYAQEMILEGIELLKENYISV